MYEYTKSSASHIMYTNSLKSILFFVLSFLVQSPYCHSTASLLTDQNPGSSSGSEVAFKKFGEDGTRAIVDDHNGFMDPKTFLTYYAIPNVPLVMRNAAKEQPAFELWQSDNYFLSLDLSDDEFVVVESRKKENRSGKTVDLNFQDFVEIYNETNQYMVNSVPEYLGNDVLLPWSLQCTDIIEDGVIDSVMWFSSGGTKSVVHTDSVDNINCLLSGNKTFVLVDPHRHWEEVPLDHPEGAYSSIDVDNVEYIKYPKLKSIEYYHVNISAGDCIFIPYRWIHQVRSYGRNIAVNVWWDHHMNEAIDLNTCISEKATITINEVNFIGFEAISHTAPQIREQFREYSRMPGSITSETLKSYLLQDYPIDFKSVLTEPIKRIMKALDVDQNGRIILNEVLFAGDDAWESVSEEIVQSLQIIQRMAQRFDPDTNTEEKHLTKDEF